MRRHRRMAWCVVACPWMRRHSVDARLRHLTSDLVIFDWQLAMSAQRRSRQPWIGSERVMSRSNGPPNSSLIGQRMAIVENVALIGGSSGIFNVPPPPHPTFNCAGPTVRHFNRMRDAGVVARPVISADLEVGALPRLPTCVRSRIGT